jgi:hypothetical protein
MGRTAQVLEEEAAVPQGAGKRLVKKHSTCAVL